MVDTNPNTVDYKVTPENLPNDGILFVDHSPNKRGGNLGHALVEYEDGKILAFYPNCDDGSHNSAKPASKGHSARGWMEYKRSEDYGQTWSDPIVLDYSKNLFDEGQAGESEKFSAFGEKAVVTAEGHIVVFFLVCNITQDTIWRRFQIPTYIISEDGGHTWGAPYELCDNRGRLYDAKYYNSEILALHFKNDNEINFLGNLDEHVYQMYVSTDGGRTFALRSELPFDTTDLSYGSMGKLESGSIIVYLYNKDAEDTMPYVISDDDGRTWSAPKVAQFPKRIRNPQMGVLNGSYFMTGRSGLFGEKVNNGHFVMYTSKDGLHWDDGTYVQMKGPGLAAYSNITEVGTLNPNMKNRLLVQASHAYEHHLTNIHHWWIDVP